MGVAWTLIAAGACREAVVRLGVCTEADALTQATESDRAWVRSGQGGGDGDGDGDGDGSGYGDGAGYGYGYGSGYGDGSGYVHSDVDYDALGDWCRRLPGQVIVCENEGAIWLPFRPFATFQPGINGSGSREVIWTNE